MDMGKLMKYEHCLLVVFLCHGFFVVATAANNYGTKNSVSVCDMLALQSTRK